MTASRLALPLSNRVNLSVLGNKAVKSATKVAVGLERGKTDGRANGKGATPKPSKKINKS